MAFTACKAWAVLANESCPARRRMCGQGGGPSARLICSRRRAKGGSAPQNITGINRLRRRNDDKQANDNTNNDIRDRGRRTRQRIRHDRNGDRSGGPNTPGLAALELRKSGPQFNPLFVTIM